MDRQVSTPTPGPGWHAPVCELPAEGGLSSNTLRDRPDARHPAGVGRLADGVGLAMDRQEATPTLGPGRFAPVCELPAQGGLSAEVLRDRPDARHPAGVGRLAEDAGLAKDHQETAPMLGPSGFAPV